MSDRLSSRRYKSYSSTVAISDGIANLASTLLLLSYPLHPPQLRIAHFPELQVRALFVQGSHDPFGTQDEVDRYWLTILHRPNSC